MRLAIFQDSVWIPGGVERVLDNLIQRLQRHNNIALFTFHFSLTGYRFLDSVERHEFRDKGHSTSHFKEYHSWTRFNALADAIQKWSPDVVILNKDPEFAEWLGAKTRRPIVIYGHNSALNRLNNIGKNGRLKSLNLFKNFYLNSFDSDRFVSRNITIAKLVICVSKEVERAYQSFCPGIKTKVVYNGVDHDWFIPTWEDQGFVLNVGRFGKSKNLELLISAFQGSKYPILLYGIPSVKSNRAYLSDDAYDERYLDRLKQAASKDFTFEIHTDQNRLRSLMQKCSLFLHPALDQGFSLTPLEAMACGKVVVAADSGGTPECVDGAGFLLQNDKIVWRTKVDELMSSESLRKELGKKAYEYSKKFAWDSTAQEFEKAVESVIDVAHC